ncbi:hypothetical protein [Bradyrhizobium ganzhouense]|uniref:hypothetical protein n=1 Tax=Bradyrhizobium ganzhouense TaxID=1179767 RepID=UPI003CF6DCD3
MPGKPTLLVTATITPPSIVTNLSRFDPRQRLEDYKAALHFYLELPSNILPRIVFVENSAGDVSGLRNLAARHRDKEIEFVTFYGLDYPPSFGRGYGEARLLDYAMDRSAIIAKLQPNDMIWKATGRLKLLNFAQLSQTAPTGTDLYCDLKDYPMPWMDMRFFAFSKTGYEHLFRGIADSLREDQPVAGVAENHLRRIVGARLGRDAIVPRFAYTPRVDGIQGNNQPYSGGIRNIAKFSIREFCRQLVPGLWI